MIDQNITQAKNDRTKSQRLLVAGAHLTANHGWGDPNHLVPQIVPLVLVLVSTPHLSLAKTSALNLNLAPQLV